MGIVGNTYATLYYRSIRNMNTITIKRVPVSVNAKFKQWRQGKPSTRGRLQVNAKVGLFYSTSTGNTEAAAEWIQEKFAKHGDIAAPVDICEANVSDMQAFDSLIVDAPTWNTGADEGRSGTAWDEVIEEIKDLDLSGKKVAVFGCGDSSSYGDYFCDAIEEVYSAMKDAGATMVGFVDPSGYDFAESKSVIDGKFCGLPLDEDNESDMTEDRVAAWCKQISGEGLA